MKRLFALMGMGLGACGPGLEPETAQARSALALATLEVNQAVGGTTRFVAGKPTVVLAWLRDKVAVDPQTQKVKVSRNGAPVVELSAHPSAEPTDLLEFRCPSLEACGGWQAGAYRFEAELNGTTSVVEATFVPRRPLRVLAVPLRAKYGTTDADIREPDDKWKRGGDFMRSTWPLAHDGLKWELRDTLDVSRFNLMTDEGQREVWQALANLNPPRCATQPRSEGCYDMIKGFVKSRIGDMQGYTMGMPAGVSVNDDEDMPATVAHEIAHPFGVGDEYKGGSYACAVNPTPKDFVGKDFNEPSKMGFRCEASGTTAFSEGTGKAGDGTLVSSATVHPYDVGGRGRLSDSISFMGSGAKQVDNWISLPVYEHLFQKLDPAAAAPRANGRVLSVEGFLARHGNGYAAQVPPWFSYEGPLPTSIPGGEFSVRILDGNGVVLFEQPLEVDFNPPIDPPRSLDVAQFDAPLALSPAARKVQIMHRAAVLKEVPVSAHAPEVEWLGLEPFALLSGEQTLRWAGRDSDGDTLSYAVEYSDDDGATWSVLAPQLGAPEWVENFDDLAGGDTVRLRVTATDGIHTQSAVSAPLQVPVKPPEVILETPPGAVADFNGVVELEGAAWDVQDGWLDGRQLGWSSDIDGPLGSGEELTAQLRTVERHTVTLTATNSKGRSSTQSFSVEVQRRPVPPGAVGLACGVTGLPPFGLGLLAVVALARRGGVRRRLGQLGALFLLVSTAAWASEPAPLGLTVFGANSERLRAQLERDLCVRYDCTGGAKADAPAKVALFAKVEKRSVALRLATPAGITVAGRYPLQSDGRMPAWAAKEASQRVVQALEALQEPEPMALFDVAPFPESKVASSRPTAAAASAPDALKAPSLGLQPPPPAPRAMEVPPTLAAPVSLDEPRDPLFSFYAASEIFSRGLVYLGASPSTARPLRAPLMIAPQLGLRVQPLRGVVGWSFDADVATQVSGSVQVLGDGPQFPARMLRINVGSRLLFHPVKGSAFSFGLGVGFRVADSWLGPGADGGMLAMLPSINVRALRGSTFLEVPLTRRVGLFAEGALLQGLSAGEIMASHYFGGGYSYGLEACAGARAEIGGGVEVRLTGQLTRYVFLFAGTNPDGTTGATDSYAGFSLQVRYSLL